MSGEDVQHSNSKRAVLVLLAPHPCWQIHQRRERAIRTAYGPYPNVFVGVKRSALADKPDGSRCVACLLNNRLESGSQRVFYRVVMTPERAVLDVDGFGEISGNNHKPVLSHVVHPLDDFRNRSACSPNIAGFLEQLDRDFLLFAGFTVPHCEILSLHWQVLDRKAGVLERVFRPIYTQRQIIRDRITNIDQSIR